MCSPTDLCGVCGRCERDALQDVAAEVGRYVEQENDELRWFITLTLPGDGLKTATRSPSSATTSKR